MMDIFEGLSEAAATASAEGRGYAVRVTSRDGVHAVVTRDYRPHDRVNFTVVGGIVEKAVCG